MRAGMAFTVEPGLYIASDDKQFAQEFRGMGIRIGKVKVAPRLVSLLKPHFVQRWRVSAFLVEDIVWLGPNGPENLTGHLCPSELSAVLNLRKQRISEDF